MDKETRIHPETGEVLRRDVRPIEFTYKGEKIFVDMPGWYPADNDEGIFTHEDLDVAEKVFEELDSRHRMASAGTDFELGNAASA